jgi:uncharacterized protein YbaR (Trm112 family)
MDPSLLALLRCPFCGTALTLVDSLPVQRDGDRIMSAVLGCACCAYPVVAGIPVVIVGDRERAAMNAIEAGQHDQALDLMLDLDPPRRAAFAALVARGDAATYREALDILSPDAEGTYFVYRLSDPTFVTASAVLRAVADTPGTLNGWVVDVCGGAGHLTRLLGELRGTGPGGTIVADLYYWKLWLATRLTAPGAHAVCCDGNDPLPFARGLASLVVLSDAFPYIWRRRALAEELMRLTGPAGTLVMPHLHNALGENVSAGMPLTPAAYADLFAPLAPRLFPDSALFDDVVERATVDLTRNVAADALGPEPSFTLVASREPGVFARRPVPPRTAVTGTLAVNPLYAVSRDGDTTTLTLQFPTPEYEEEFGACRRYLPEVLTLAADLTAPLDAARLRASLGGAVYDDLRRRLVLIDAPPRYC